MVRVATVYFSSELALSQHHGYSVCHCALNAVQLLCVNRVVEEIAIAQFAVSVQTCGLILLNVNSDALHQIE